MTTNEKEIGLYQKYIVEKVDGKTDPNAHYIVLRYDKKSNDAERRALKFYAWLIKRKGYLEFAKSLLQEIAFYENLINTAQKSKL